MRYTREDKERLLADWVESGMPGLNLPRFR